MSWRRSSAAERGVTHGLAELALGPVAGLRQDAIEFRLDRLGRRSESILETQPTRLYSISADSVA